MKNEFIKRYENIDVFEKLNSPILNVDDFVFFNIKCILIAGLLLENGIPVWGFCDDIESARTFIFNGKQLDYILKELKIK